MVSNYVLTYEQLVSSSLLKVTSHNREVTC